MKKGLTLLLTVVMVLTMVTANASAASFTDTEGKNCETAVDVLAALGIVEGKSEGVYEPDSSLTRAEMTAIILRTMNMAETAEGRNIFTDVPSSHWAYASIAAAYQLGIVNGTSATTFEPDKTVTYEQAVKMVVAALGYTVQAEAAGGYPSGYLSKASQLDLLKGVAMGGDMTRGNMAVLVYNALDTELFLQTEFGDVAYGESDETLLSYYLKVTKVTEKITATPIAQFKSASQARKLLGDEVAIGEKILKKGETNAQDMLGVRSDIYYRTDGDTEIPTILAIVPRANVEIIDVVAQDIDGKTDKTEFIYTDAEGNDREITISGATLIYNGREEEMNDDRIEPDLGTVRLVSEAGGVNLVIVWEFDNYVVENVIPNEYEVYYEGSSTPIVIDFNDNSLPTVMTDAEGTDVPFESLAKWDILSVAESLPHNATKARRIYRSNTMVSGEVKEISGDEVTIGETVYAVAPSFDISDVELGMNAAYYLDFTGAIAAVDESYDTSRIYGWLQNAELTKGLNAKPQLKLFTQDGEWKVFDIAENVRFNGQGRDSASLLDGAQAEPDLWGYDVAPSLVMEDGTVVPQLIAYKTNAEGVITEIETAVNKTNPTIEDEKKIGNEFSMDWYMHDGTGISKERARVRGFNGEKEGDTENLPPVDANLELSGGTAFSRVYLNENTKYFLIPKDVTKDDAYEIRAVKSFNYVDFRVMHCVSYYDVSEGYECGAMVMRMDMSGGDAGSNYPDNEVMPALVTRVTTIMNSDGELVKSIKMINASGQDVAATAKEDFELFYNAANVDITKDEAYYYKSGESKIYPAKGSSPDDWKGRDLRLSANDLQPGDVIQYEVDGQNQLTRAAVFYRANKNFYGDVEFCNDAGTIKKTSTNNNYQGGALSLAGTVLRSLEKGVLVEVNLSDEFGQKSIDATSGEVITAKRALPLSGKYILWDSEKETATQITAADVVQGDRVYSFWKTTSQRLVVVYRNLVD